MDRRLIPLLNSLPWVAIISGATYEKIIEQIDGYYPNVLMPMSGNLTLVRPRQAHVHYGQYVRVQPMNVISPQMEAGIIRWIDYLSNMPGAKTGLGKEYVKYKMYDGCNLQISYSPIGHDAPQQVKNAFDPDFQLRRHWLSMAFNHFKYPDFAVSIGGTTCFDFSCGGKGKNIRSLESSMSSDSTVFFGDAIFPHGNDYSAARECDISYTVNGPSQTFKILQGLCV